MPLRSQCSLAARRVESTNRLDRSATPEVLLKCEVGGLDDEKMFTHGEGRAGGPVSSGPPGVSGSP